MNVIRNEEIAACRDDDKEGRSDKYNPTLPIKPFGVASPIGELWIMVMVHRMSPCAAVLCNARSCEKLRINV